VGLEKRELRCGEPLIVGPASCLAQSCLRYRSKLSNVDLALLSPTGRNKDDEFHALKKDSAPKVVEPHPDERQVRLDTDRSFVLYPVGELCPA
jgi:hypothetical protein